MTKKIFFASFQLKSGPFFLLEHVTEEHKVLNSSAFKKTNFVPLYIDIIEAKEQWIEYGKTPLFGNYFQ